MAVCVAVIGKENWPVYVACSEAEAEMQWRVHTALDVAEERLSSGRAPDQRDLYLGLLYSTEAHNIYGYVTNTRVKLFAVVGEGGARDAEVRSLLRRLHALYADALCCPFYRPGDAITSPVSFEELYEILFLCNEKKMKKCKFSKIKQCGMLKRDIFTDSTQTCPLRIFDKKVRILMAGGNI